MDECPVESIVLFDNVAVSAASGDPNLIIYDLTKMVVRQKITPNEHGLGGFTRLALSNIKESD